MDLSIVAPVCNEAENLKSFVNELIEVLPQTKRTFEIILVDDGSRDGSQAIIERLAAEHSSVKAIFFRRNQGQTAAFDAGFRAASGNIIVTMDSDRQNDPRDIPRMLTLIEREGFDFVTGWRRKRRDGFMLRTLPSRIANWLIRRVTGTKIHDLGCSLKAYRRELAGELRLFGEMHRFIGVLIEGLGAKVGEIEVNHRPRVAGESKYNLTRTFKVLVDLLTVWFMQTYQTKPAYVFGGCGFLMVMGSFSLTLFVFWEKWIQGVWVHRNPLFSIATFLSVVGVQFVALGLLAEVIIRTYYSSSEMKPYSIGKRIGFGDSSYPSPRPIPSSHSPTYAEA